MTLRLLLALALAVLAVGSFAVLAGGARWRSAVQARDRALSLGSAPAESIPREELPEPVVRFLDRAVPGGAPLIHLGRLRQEGTFQMGEGEDGWRPFEATEVFRGSEPGFYWDAAIRMAPGVGVRVRDAYVDGSAEMVAKVLGLVPVMNAGDSPELRRGALSRYLAEAAWIPTRLGMGPGLSWRAVDEHTAEATLANRGTEVSLRFTFSEAGDLVQVEGIREREVEGEYVPTPWIGRFREHEEVGGYRIPRYGEVAWVVDGEEKPYWRGRVTEAEFTPVGAAGATEGETGGGAERGGAHP